jgi:hypothetical protein
MTEYDKEALKDFVRGGAFIIGIASIAIIGIAILYGGDNETEIPPVEQQSTKVVGTYKGCDVVQWSYGALADYKYFLHCPK